MRLTRCLAPLLLPAFVLLAGCDDTTFSPRGDPSTEQGAVLPLVGCQPRSGLQACELGKTPVVEGQLTTPDGVNLHFRVVGDGPDAVVVLPGLHMSYLVDNLGFLSAGRTVIYVDHRGFGRSDLLADEPEQLTGEAIVNDIETVREHFGIEKLKLVGHSLGATWAALYAMTRPERVDRMVLVGAAPVAFDPFVAQFDENLAQRLTPEDQAALDQFAVGMFFGPDPVAACEGFLATLFTRYLANPANIGNHRGAWCDVPEEAARRVLIAFDIVTGSLGEFDWRPALREVSTPTLVVHGLADPIPLESSKGWAEIQGAELLVMPDAGHFPWLEDAPRFFTRVNTFLRKAAPAL